MRLAAKADDAWNCRNWCFRGFEREGSDVKNKAARASEFEWLFTIERSSSSPDEGSSIQVEGDIWWLKLKSRYGNTSGMGSWQAEHVTGRFDPSTGVLNCKGVSCGAGLALAEYEFRLEDGGLSLIENGAAINSHQQVYAAL